MTIVPLLDLKAQYAQIRAEVMPIIEEVCASQRFILGEHVLALEAEVAAYCASAAGIGVSSGTDALLLALMALGVGPGDEIFTSPFTFSPLRERLRGSVRGRCSATLTRSPLTYLRGRWLNLLIDTAARRAAT